MGSIGPKQDGSSVSLDFQVHLTADPRAGSNGVIATWDSWMSDGGAALVAYTTGTSWFGDCGATDLIACVASPMSADVREPAISRGSDGKILLGFYQVVNGVWTYNIGRADDLNKPFGFRAAASAASDTGKASDDPFTRIGDYTSVAEGSDGSVYAAWSDTRNGSQEVWGAS